MGNMRDTIYVTVEHFEGDEHDAAYYVASSDELSLVTDGETFEALLKNLQEAVSLILEENVRPDFDLLPNPSLVIVMRLPESYAKNTQVADDPLR